MGATPESGLILWQGRAPLEKVIAQNLSRLHSPKPGSQAPASPPPTERGTPTRLWPEGRTGKKGNRHQSPSRESAEGHGSSQDERTVRRSSGEKMETPKKSRTARCATVGSFQSFSIPPRI